MTLTNNYIYLSHIVFLDVSHQVNKYTRNSFFLGSYLIIQMNIFNNLVCSQEFNSSSSRNISILFEIKDIVSKNFCTSLFPPLPP